MSSKPAILATIRSHSARATSPGYLVAFVVSMVAVGALADDQHVNVLLIMTDNQGYFELENKGHPYLKTPHIDALARESVDLCNFHAENFCSPSRAALLTGRQPMRFGVYDTIGGVSLLAEGETTLATRLKSAGYRTGIFGKWHLGMSYPYHPKYRGFDEVFIHGGGGIGQLEDYLGNNHVDAHYEHNDQWVASRGFSTDVLFDRAAKFIQTSDNEPFFCYIPTPATHFPHQAEPKALQEIEDRGITRDQADLILLSMIENIDANVGSLLAKLDEWEVADNTVVIFMTDQGVGDRGSPEPVWAGRDRNDDLGNASEGKHRVFCFLRKPGLTVAGENQALTCIRDIFPTVLDVCGLPIPSNIDGRSLRPLLEGNDDWEDDRLLIMQCPRNRKRTKWRHTSVKRGDWRLVSEGRLYNIATDSQQARDVAQEHPDIVAPLNQAYDAFWESLPAPEELVNRHILGATEAPTTQLCAMDWYEGDAPWTQGGMRKLTNQGIWKVRVANGGRYRFALRRTQQETPRPVGAKSARLKIGDREVETSMQPEDAVAFVELALEPGEYDMQTYFQEADDPDHTWGAYFVDVEHLTGS